MNEKPKELLQVDPEHGFYPHFTDEFRKEYGAESVFVFAVADVLTARFIKVLIKAGRVSPNTKPRQLGSLEAVEMLEKLILILEAKKPSSKEILPLLQEATGRASLGTFSKEVNSLLGDWIFEKWLCLFQDNAFGKAAELVENL
jgi:hypothetical protein